MRNNLTDVWGCALLLVCSVMKAVFASVGGQVSWLEQHSSESSVHLRACATSGLLGHALVIPDLVQMTSIMPVHASVLSVPLMLRSTSR